MIATLFHGGSSIFEMRRAELDAKGTANLNFKEVNVDSDYIRFQVFNHGKVFRDNHVGTINVRVSELVSSPARSDGKINQENCATYELVKSSKKDKTADLILSYRLSMAGKDLAAVVPTSKQLYEKPELKSKCLAAAIRNDVHLFKMVLVFVLLWFSLNWSWFIRAHSSNSVLL